MLPWLVAMLALTWAGSVGTLPVRGRVVRLARRLRRAGYWQFAPRSAGAANAGSGPGWPGRSAGAAEWSGVVVAADAVWLSESLLVMTTVATTAPTTTIAPTPSR